MDMVVLLKAFTLLPCLVLVVSSRPVLDETLVKNLYRRDLSLGKRFAVVPFGTLFAPSLGESFTSFASDVDDGEFSPHI